jgi:Spy/CpxP family protein refolding chaperone
MKNNYYVHVLMMAGAALLLFTAPSMAMEKEHGPGMGPMGGEGQMKHQKAGGQEEEKSLGLTDEQRTKMKTLREASKVQQEALRAEIKAKHEALRQELDAANPDRGKAESIVKELSALEQKMGLDRVDMVFQVRAILTPEQYQKLQALHEKRRAEMKKQQSGKKAEGHREHTEEK